MSSHKAWRLYLDFDGVLNNEPLLRHQRNHVPVDEHRLFDPENVEAANLLCSGLPVASVVITSSWREDRTLGELQVLLRDAGFGFSQLLVGATARLGDRTREIREHRAGAVRSECLVLDDEALGELAGCHVIRTSTSRGLDRELVSRVLLRLRPGED